jgi:hypothetical protein
LDHARSEGWLELVSERIPQREALQIARSSDGLLLLQPQSATQVPGKLFEYLQIGRPILALVPPDSPSERLLQRSGVPYRCVYHGSTPEATDDAVAGFFDLPSMAVAPNVWFEEQFNAESQTRTFHSLIQSLHHDANEPFLDFSRPAREVLSDRDAFSSIPGDEQSQLMKRVGGVRPFPLDT